MIALVHDAAQAPAESQAPALPPGLRAAWWPLERLGDGLEALARVSGLRPPGQATEGRDTALVPPEALAADVGLATRWLDWAAGRLGLELESVDAAVPEVEALLDAAGPALVPLADPRQGMGFVLLLGGRGRRARLLSPALERLPLPREALRQALVEHHESPLRPGIAALLDAAGVPPRRRARASAALLRERLAAVRLAPWWMLRLPATAPMTAQARRAGLHGRLLALLGVSALLYGAEIGAWGLIGQGVLDGRLDLGWLAAWVLLLAVMLPLQLAGGALNAAFSLGTSRLVKSRLLAGALRMDVDDVRRQGLGALLGRVIESQALEALVVGGGLGTLVALLELGFAAGVLALGAAPGAHLALLAAWLLLVVGLAGHWGRRLREWTLERLSLTHVLIEQMVGHRTRLAQERAARRDAQDDARLSGYLQRAAALDGASLPLQAALPSAWLAAALALLAPAFTSGQVGAGALAVSLGGVLLAQRAFMGIAGGLSSLARAGIAWQQVGAMFKAGRHDPSRDAPHFVDHDPERRPVPTGAPLVDAQGLRLAYDGAEPVLRGLDLRIAAGERVLLLGPSGGGKSTLGALLAGLRRPQSGLLLLRGLDAPTLGTQWQALATAAPQFHENHVLSGSLAFNLLMGREWPAGPALRAEAESLCRELGLGPLLDRMPAGLDQRIGETGWQLSHGERSRLFLARALLQRAPLTVLDESFAALDPETLARCLQAVHRRAQTLVVIAHP
ncbi:MAG: ABC transporter ATP-binding protein [Rubrivivax sp.]|nr:ABC transporter ATP-binding protein [Rubrivivax sp.]